MSENDISLSETKLKKIFESVGVIISDEKESIIVDSLVFVNLIVEIEDLFSICVEVEMLDKSKLNCFEDYLRMVERCLKKDE